MTQKLWLKGSIEYYLENKRFGAIEENVGYIWSFQFMSMLPTTYSIKNDQDVWFTLYWNPDEGGGYVVDQIVFEEPKECLTREKVKEVVSQILKNMGHNEYMEECMDYRSYAHYNLNTLLAYTYFGKLSQEESKIVHEKITEKFGKDLKIQVF